MMSSRELNILSRRIIGCAIEVHRYLGPGLLESVYEEALCCEFEWGRIPFARQRYLPIIYRKGRKLATKLRLDLLVADEVIVEVKSAEQTIPVYEAQLVSYLRLSRKTLGLLINFNVPILREEIRKKVNLFPTGDVSAPSASLR